MNKIMRMIISFYYRVCNLFYVFRYRVFKILHPVVILALVGVVLFFISIADQPIGDSIVYLMVFVTLALPMLIISLCINIYGF